MRRISKHKGMTLMECVVSIAVYAVMASLLVEIMTAVNGTIKATKHLNRRLAYEAKYADNLITSAEGVSFPSIESTVGIKFRNGSGTEVNLTARGNTYTAQYNDPDYNSQTNYRFAVFKKNHISTTAPEGPFWITIKINKYYYDTVSKSYKPDPAFTGPIDQITRIKITSTTTDFFPQSILTSPITDYDDNTLTVNSDEITVDFNGAHFATAKGADLIRIPVYVPWAYVNEWVDPEDHSKGQAPVKRYAELGTGKLHIEFYKDMTGSLGTLFADELFMEADLEFCDNATSPSGAKNYYREAIYGFDGTGFQVITAAIS